ncbi:MAG TPA: hypothetical protein VK871_05365, partial [Candidatus Limnocylindrales bacterium]|nr:hypothetical protein [Candidatus Limnocylindrales bacterium]
GPEIDMPVPDEVLDKMEQIPYCIQASDPNGLELEQFNDHPATIDTVKAFSKGLSSLEGFVAERMKAAAERRPAAEAQPV